MSSSTGARLPARHVASPLDRARRRVDRRDRRRRASCTAFPRSTKRARASTSTPRSLLRPLLAGLAIQPNLDQQVALMSRTLISRPNVEKLVRMADLDLGARTARRARRARRRRDEDDSPRRQRRDESLRHQLSRPESRRRRRRSSSRCWRSSSSRASATSARTRGPRSSSSTTRSSATKRRCRRPRTGSRTSGSSTWACRRSRRAGLLRAAVAAERDIETAPSSSLQCRRAGA